MRTENAGSKTKRAERPVSLCATQVFGFFLLLAGRLTLPGSRILGPALACSFGMGAAASMASYWLTDGSPLPDSHRRTVISVTPTMVPAQSDWV